ncbi:MAG: D-alanine--D-alanine ligase [Gammaproteobacteria bacterium]|nr:D-alanine--D-alanine ligase [Gammaproteobacteria bacterium]
MKTIAIIEGGYSSEKVISLKSAQTVHDALDSEQLYCIRVRIDDEGWRAYYKKEWLDINRANFTIMYKDTEVAFDYAFIAIHGEPGENGQLQAYFDLLSIPYSTCNQLISAVTFNKFLCNQYLSSLGVPIAKSLVFEQNAIFQMASTIEQVNNEIKYPCFVKPTESGSSFGVSRVSRAEDLEKAIVAAFEHGKQIMVEAYLAGREISSGVYQSYKGIHVLPLTEIRTENEFFDYQAKYEGSSEEITPAPISEAVTEMIQDQTRTIYEKLPLRGICRVDYMITETGPVLIEINTVPGFSAESIIPQMAACAGISLNQLFTDVVEYTSYN